VHCNEVVVVRFLRRLLKKMMNCEKKNEI